MQESKLISLLLDFVIYIEKNKIQDNSRIRLELEGPNELKKCLEASEGFGCLDETENLPKLNASSRIS